MRKQQGKEKEEQPDFTLKHPLTFSQLNKVLFPDLKLTKLDILTYYDSLSEHILPYMIDRPQFLRWHRGDIKKSIYNKSITRLRKETGMHIPSWVEVVKLPSVTYQEQREYIVCADKDHLLFLIQTGCIELSPWHSIITSLDYPDYVVIDLDPVDISFNDVVEVALAAKEVLDVMELPSFLKTSGSKGMHIYIPLDAKTDYTTSREFCHLVCQVIHKRIPEITSLNRLPEHRRGKVYLDYLQNSFGKTIAAPYCIRPNEFAGVATPLYWEDLNSSFNVSDFNYYTILNRLKDKGDPFEKLFHQVVNAGEKLSMFKKKLGPVLK